MNFQTLDGKPRDLSMTKPELQELFETVELRLLTALCDDPAAVPDETALTAFFLDGANGLVINPGVWHSPGLALSGTLDFILTVRKETADDIDIKKIAPRRILL